MFLLTLRPDGTHLAGHWEFPGGKVHDSETHAEALRREIFEELDAVARVGDLVHTVTHAYPEKTVQLFFYKCDLDGEAKPMMGQQMRWVAKQRAVVAAVPGSRPRPDYDAVALIVAALRQNAFIEHSGISVCARCSAWRRNPSAPG